jgi:hypothetical protein
MHWAESAILKANILNKHISGLNGKCVEIPNDSYIQPLANISAEI